MKRKKLRDKGFIAIILAIVVIGIILNPNQNRDRIICIDCAPGHIGGGCTYTDEVTGKLVEPEACVPYDMTKEIKYCPPLSRDADACIQLYKPVCGNDAKTYSNSCFACMNENVAFYIDGTCEEVIKNN